MADSRQDLLAKLSESRRDFKTLSDSSVNTATPTESKWVTIWFVVGISVLAIAWYVEKFPLQNKKELSDKYATAQSEVDDWYEYLTLQEMAVSITKLDENYKTPYSDAFAQFATRYADYGMSMMKTWHAIMMQDVERSDSALIYAKMKHYNQQMRAYVNAKAYQHVVHYVDSIGPFFADVNAQYVEREKGTEAMKQNKFEVKRYEEIVVYLIIFGTVLLNLSKILKYWLLKKYPLWILYLTIPIVISTLAYFFV